MNNKEQTNALIKANTSLARVNKLIAVTNKLLQSLDPVLIPYRKKDKWGFCTPDKKIVIECVYDEVDPFDNVLGLACVCRSSVLELYDYVRGYIDKTGRLIIPCIFDSNYFFESYEKSFFDSLIWLLEGYYWSLINSEGQMVVSKWYLDEVRPFSEGIAAIKEMDGKWGYIDKTGRQIIPFLFDCAYSFHEGFALVGEHWYGGDKGYIDKTGQIVISYSFYDARQFSEGLAAVRYSFYEKWGYINKKGEEVAPFSFDSAYSFSGGLAAVEKKGKWGFIDQTGKVAIPFLFESANSFSEGLAAVCKEGDWGYIDVNGQIIIYNLPGECKDFSEGLAAIEKDGKWGYIDKSGKQVIPFLYISVESFSNGLAKVDYGYVDKNGTEYWED